MENSLIIEKHKLRVFDILKEALIISTKNIKFLIFTLFTSLPLFFFLVYYEIFLQTTLVESIKILTPPPNYYNYNWPIPGYISKQLDKDFFYKLIQLFLLYLVPVHLLELCTVLVTVDLASKIYKGERLMTLKDMVHKPIHNQILRGTFVTSIYVISLSTCILPGLIWMVTNCYVILRNRAYDIFFTLFYGVGFIVLLAKYLEWSAVWNLSIVISIVEEKMYGVQALALSEFFRRGRKQQGSLLMLVFFAWGLGLRLVCLSAGCYEGGNGIVVQISLFCIGNVIKWVACLVYFYDCKRQKLEKKDDEEVGREVKAGDK